MNLCSLGFYDYPIQEFPFVRKVDRLRIGCRADGSAHDTSSMAEQVRILFIGWSLAHWPPNGPQVGSEGRGALEKRGEIDVRQGAP
jgi:hypothetical protein